MQFILKILYMLLLGCLSIIPAAAQRNLSGTVCDSNGEPLIGATVSVEGRKGDPHTRNHRTSGKTGRQ